MVLFGDTMDAYGATSDLTKKWASQNSLTNLVAWGAANGRFGGGGLSCPVSNVAQLTTYGLGSSVTNFAAAFWMKCATAPASGGTIIAAFAPLSGALVTGSPRAALNFNGTLGLAGSAAGMLYGTSNVCDGVWHWIELYYNVATTKVAVDGAVDMISLTANSCVGGESLQLGYQATGGASLFIDDLIVWDDQVGLQAGELRMSNWPIGAQKGEMIQAVSPGSNTNWAPLSGANYANINETAPDGDTSYNSASVSGIRDSYVYGDITGINPLVAMVNCYAKNADAGSINIQGLAYASSTFKLGDSKAAPSAYRTLQFPIFRDPATNAAWTKAGINATEFGVGVV